MNTNSRDEIQMLQDISQIRKSLECLEGSLINFDERKTVALERIANYLEEMGDHLMDVKSLERELKRKLKDFEK